jgi:hypothetical protein
VFLTGKTLQLIKLYFQRDGKLYNIDHWARTKKSIFLFWCEEMSGLPHSPNFVNVTIETKERERET